LHPTSKIFFLFIRILENSHARNIKDLTIKDKKWAKKNLIHYILNLT
jgi:hypothetical protein